MSPTSSDQDTMSNSSPDIDLQLNAPHINPISSFQDNADQANFSRMDIEPTRFSTITDPTAIAKLVRRKDEKLLRDYGRVEGIVSALETDVENGILGDRNDIHDRKKKFGSNRFKEQNLRLCLRHFAWESIKEPMILVLFVCSMLSLVFGIQKNGYWQEGAAGLVAILAAITISSAGNFWPTFQCLKFSNISRRIPQVDVVRNGSWQQIAISSVVVGDIAFLKPGDQVPADGLFIAGCALETDVQVERAAEAHDRDNPFLSFGSTVVNGYARMVVTAVGKEAAISLKGTLLEEMKRLGFVAEKIVKAVAWVNFAALLVKFLAEDFILHEDKKGNDWGAMVRIIATPVMIALSSSSEELVMAVKTGFAYSMKKMMGIGVLVRDPSMCHSLACVTTLCVNKTGTLTMDSMEVAKFWQGLNSIEEAPLDFIAPNVLELLHQGIGLNTTQPPSRPSSVASATNSTEKAIFNWAVGELGMDVETQNRSCTILEIEPFNSRNRSSGVLISKSSDNTIHVHRKGAPDVIIPMCSHYYESTGNVKLINKNTKALLGQILEGMAENGLRCFAFAHRKTSIRDYFTFSDQKLILLGLVGLKNLQRKGTRKAVEECQKAGINLKLITGDSPTTAKAIATKCGILSPIPRVGEVVEGKDFRGFTAEERMARVENIRVLANASPVDKFLMVQCLKRKGHVVACLGQGIGDVMALREANVALCFGSKSSAEIAKASSAVVLSCKDFSLIIDILKWGRGLYDGIQAYAQFFITATFVALIFEFVKTVSGTGLQNSTPYPVFQLLWVKIITGTFSALAIIIKPPAEGLFHRPPTSRKQPLITSLVRTNICIQVVYQVCMLLTTYFKGRSLFNVNSDRKEAIILNTYILCQVFAMFDATFSETNNIFEEIQKKKESWGIMGLILLVQLLMFEVLKKFAGTVRLGWGLWAVCAAMAAPSFLVSGLARNLSALKDIINWPILKPKVD